MSFQLTNLSDPKETINCNTTYWTLILNIAECCYGWEPQRTKKPKGYPLFKKWPGYYDTNDGQIVGNSDAINLRTSLKIAIIDPDFGSKCIQLSAEIQNEIEKQTGEKMDYKWGGELPPDSVKDLIEFLSKGSFRID